MLFFIIGYSPIFSVISPINLSSLFVDIVYFDIVCRHRADSREWLNLIIVNYEYYNTNNQTKCCLNDSFSLCSIFIFLCSSLYRLLVLCIFWGLVLYISELSGLIISVRLFSDRWETALVKI